MPAADAKSRTRQLNRECAALPYFTFDAYFPAEGLGQVFDDGQAQAGAAQLSGTGLIDAIETLEHPPLIVRLNADPRVANSDADGGTLDARCWMLDALCSIRRTTN